MLVNISYTGCHVEIDYHSWEVFWQAGCEILNKPGSWHTNCYLVLKLEWTCLCLECSNESCTLCDYNSASVGDLRNINAKPWTTLWGQFKKFALRMCQHLCKHNK